MKETIIGIDPGASGGIAVFSNGRIQAVKMPKDVREMQSYLKPIIERHDNIMVFIEKVQAHRGKKVEDLEGKFIELYKLHRHPKILFEKFEEFRNQGDDAPGKKFGINKMLKNYAQLITVVSLLDVPFFEVYPVSWQSKLGLSTRGLNVTKTERKNLYKTYAQNAFPELKVNMATSDALCLVQFGMNKLVNDQIWINDHIQNEPKNDLFN